MNQYKFVKWYINNCCNLHCPFCLVSESGTSIISIDMAKKILDKMSDEGVETIDFFGKEPLFDETIFHIMQYGKSKGYTFRYMFISNGKNLSKYSAQIINSPCRDFTISYDFHSGNRNYKFNLEDLKTFKGLGFNIELSIDVHSNNIENILYGVNNLENFGVSSLYFKPILPYKNSDSITEKDFAYFIYRFFEIFRGSQSVKFSIPFQMKELTKRKHLFSDFFYTEPVCTSGKDSFCIDWEGRAYGCAMQCSLGINENTCEYLECSQESLFELLSNHRNRERMCIVEGYNETAKTM